MVSRPLLTGTIPPRSSSSSSQQRPGRSTTPRDDKSDDYGVHGFLRYGGLFLTTRSGCRMARWVYESPAPGQTRECAGYSDAGRRLTDAVQLGDHDTVFVPTTDVGSFVEEVLGSLAADIVVISGRTAKAPVPDSAAVSRLLNHPRILHWFCQNTPLYVPHDPRHPKLSPFPYGLKESGKAVLPQPPGEKVQEFRAAFLGALGKEKTDFIFAGPLGTTGGWRGNTRKGIPKSGMMTPSVYFERMANSRYVLSPDGDRPECYRHYEAIGLGAVPITELDPYSFRHLAPAHTVFNNTEWNVRALEKKLDRTPKVDKNMVFEGYWQDWCEGAAGTKLNWRAEAVGLDSTGNISMREWMAASAWLNPRDINHISS